MARQHALKSSLGKRGKPSDCPVEVTVKVIGGRWKPVILYYLIEEGTKRYGELRRLLTGITQRSLTVQLRSLSRVHPEALLYRGARTALIAARVYRYTFRY